MIQGDKGDTNSTAVRALADLFEEVPVVEGCHFNCHPHHPEEMCDLATTKTGKDGLRWQDAGRQWSIYT